MRRVRRADRLFQLVQTLRRRPVVTAAALARDLEVSERAVYRDISDLVRSGVPIDGEAGVGYTLRRGFDLPPLMFTALEIEAMVLGARIVASWSDPALARAASDGLARIEAAVPDRLKQRLQQTPLFAPDGGQIPLRHPWHSPLAVEFLTPYVGLDRCRHKITDGLPDNDALTQV